VAKKARQERQVPWTTGVLCQRFFQSRAASGWFKVGRSSGAVPAVEGRVVPVVEGKVVPAVEGGVVPAVEGRVVPVVEGGMVPATEGAVESEEQRLI